MGFGHLHPYGAPREIDNAERVGKCPYHCKPSGLGEKRQARAWKRAERRRARENAWDGWEGEGIATGDTVTAAGVEGIVESVHADGSVVVCCLDENELEPYSLRLPFGARLIKSMRDGLRQLKAHTKEDA